MSIASKIQQEKALPGFEKISRYWDPGRKLVIAKVLPGEVYVTKHHELITTLLGSCIAVCMQDKRNGVGGMNHFKLPTPPGKSSARDVSNDTNYGIYAMELLINGIITNGGDRKYLQCKIFGGGNVVQAITNNIGEKNIAFVKDFMRQERIPILKQSIGGTAGQQVYYHPITGNDFSVTQGKNSIEEVKEAESIYLAKVNNEMDDNNIIFF